MKRITGTLKDRSATIILDHDAKRQYQPGHYRFILRGLPVFWTVEHARYLAQKCLAKQGLTHIDLVMTHSTLSKWNACVSFYVPSEIIPLS